MVKFNVVFVSTKRKEMEKCNNMMKIFLSNHVTVKEDKNTFILVVYKNGSTKK